MAVLHMVEDVKREDVKLYDNAKDIEFEALIRKASQGARQALVELCEQIARGVLSRVTRMVGNATVAEDISQEVLIRVCENIGSLREPKAFKVWLSKIIKNEVNRDYKKNVKHSGLVSIDFYSEEINIVEENPELLPYESVEVSEARDAVKKAMPALSARQREAVMLYYYDDLSIVEVAKAMNVTKQSVSEFLAISRDKLRRELERLEHSSAKEG